MKRLRIAAASVAIASIGLAVPAALAGSASAAPAAHGTLVNVELINILNHNHTTILKNVPISVAAGVCDVNVNVLTRQVNHRSWALCPAKSTNRAVGIVYR